MTEDDDRRDGPPAGGFVVRRIVVAVDGSDHSQAALETAAALAAQLQAEIEALFVEDIDLYNLAALPFGTEFDLITGRPRRLSDRVLTAQLRGEAERVRRALDALARRSRLRSTFRVARGRVAAEVLAAAGGADLLILGSAGRAVGVFRAGRVALAAAEHAPRPVLLMRSGARLRGRPLVPYDGSPGARRALEAAASIARMTRHHHVHVAITEPDAAKAAALRREAAQALHEAGIAVTFVEEIEGTLETMCRLIARTEADLLVLDADDPKLAGPGRARLLEAAPCPLLLVR